MTAFQPVDTAIRDFRPVPITDDEAAAMFRAVVNLFGKWDVTDEQASTLLDVPVRSYRRWKADGEPGRIDRDGKARLSNLIGIHKALRYMFRETRRAHDWIKAPNSAFQGRSALDIMLGGELTDLMRVRRYLDAERGGWSSIPKRSRFPLSNGKARSVSSAASTRRSICSRILPILPTGRCSSRRSKRPIRD